MAAIITILIKGLTTVDGRYCTTIFKRCFNIIFRSYFNIMFLIKRPVLKYMVAPYRLIK